MADAAEGLDHLIEKHSLLHLDVKPKNLFLISDRVKVADFGLVSCIERNSAAGMMAGITPVYTSPETFQNKISKQSDQYSLAIVYTELLSGKRPFNGKNIRQLALQHMTQPPDLSCLPETDRAAVDRALSKNPGRPLSDLPRVRPGVDRRVDDGRGDDQIDVQHECRPAARRDVPRGNPASRNAETLVDCRDAGPALLRTHHADADRPDRRRRNR